MQASVLTSDWIQEKLTHEQRVDDLIGPYLVARSHHKKQPVLDFLFEYYHFRPAMLRKWSPGLGVELSFSDQERQHLPQFSELQVEGTIAFLDPSLFPEKRRKSLEWVIELLEQTQQKRPQFGCFGLHEWAMVYRSDDPRHTQVPLRFSTQEIAEIVESHHLICTHFDAYRFFTPEAVPLNKHQLSREVFIEKEQPGCIHTNMDVYKWAYKFYPWVSSETILAAFELAYKARYIDMKASPYDLSDQGVLPIKIETLDGKQEYKFEQEALSKKAKPIRAQLIEELKQLSI
jgi:hypothetical protein